MAALASAEVRGFCGELADHVVAAAASGARRGDTAGTGGPERTVVWGLQRPPLGTQTWLRVDSDDDLDALAPTLLPFYATNARDAVVVSVDAAAAATRARLEALPGLDVRVQDAEAFAAESQGAYNVVPAADAAAAAARRPLAQQFLSLYLPMGHVKSTTRNDAAFLAAFEGSAKWLALAP